jgi:hypothetical protein
MKLKTLLAALALTVTPVFAFAQCGGHSEASMSCMDGKTWDAASSTCVDKSTS